jgi:1-acyl-sn-glycerol-3-phosphate acyltransferase
MDFKGGLFLAAVKTGVPIVPITIHHTHAVMPSNSFFPVQSGNGKLHVHVHDEIDTTGKTEEELVSLVRRAFISTLPLEQHPLENMSMSQDESVVVETKAAATKNETTVAA